MCSGPGGKDGQVDSGGEGVGGHEVGSPFITPHHSMLVITCVSEVYMIHVCMV